ncbi:MAG: EVE domain-containing protein [Pseudomonadota bacterium]
MQYWLMKSEPKVFGLDDLAARPGQREPWDGVRNYQARNWLRDDMKPGDRAFFYHSNCEVPGILGLMEIVTPGYPDPSQFDATSRYFDPLSDPGRPRWYLVDVRYLRHLCHPISLTTLRRYTDGPLAGFRLLQKGSRLSIMPVSEDHCQFILDLEC